VKKKKNKLRDGRKRYIGREEGVGVIRVHIENNHSIWQNTSRKEKSESNQSRGKSAQKGRKGGYVASFIN